MKRVKYEFKVSLSPGLQCTVTRASNQTQFLSVIVFAVIAYCISYTVYRLAVSGYRQLVWTKYMYVLGVLGHKDILLIFDVLGPPTSS